MDPKRFDQAFTVDIPKLNEGRNDAEFTIDRSFFEHFSYSPVQEGQMKVTALLEKFTRHIDARFHFEGVVTLHCDRCTEPYPHALAFDQRMIFTFEEGQEWSLDEVVVLTPEQTQIHLAADFYDFIMLQLPLRKVPPASVHECPEEVKRILGITGAEEEGEESEATEHTDPRWEGLEELKKKFKDNN